MFVYMYKLYAFKNGYVCKNVSNEGVQWAEMEEILIKLFAYFFWGELKWKKFYLKKII